MYLIKMVPYRLLSGVIVAMLLLKPHLLFSMEAIDGEHAGHASQHHEHHHHAVIPGIQRSLVSYTIPAVNMFNQDGEQIALPELLDSGQPVMLNFIFTTCSAICPPMSATFARVQKMLGSESAGLRMVSVSIDPEHDTPEKLSAYARRFGAGPQWQFLTGSLDDSITVQRAFDADRGDKMNHAPLTLFRAMPEAKWVRYEGFATAEQLVDEYRGSQVGLKWQIQP